MTAPKVIEHKLDNGLKVLLVDMKTAPVVSVWIWYNVGSRNEHPGITGISHWVEHMLFKGTEEIPEGEIFKSISRCGGNNNAFTMEDFTCYFETLPSEDLELALKIESDRMVNTRFAPEQVESERTVIISELEMYENDPATRLYNEVKGVAYNAHPYRWDVGGYKCDIEKITRDELYNYYKNHYAPDNATLVIAGDFQEENAMELVKKYFGDLKPTGVKHDVRTVEPPQNGEKRVELRLPGNAVRWLACYHIPNFIHEDIPALLVLDAVLSGAKPISFSSAGFMGRSARLYDLLVNKKALAVAVSTSVDKNVDPGLFTVSMTLRDGADPMKAEQFVFSEIEKLRKKGPTPKELSKAIKQAKAQVEYSRDGISSNALIIGYFDVLGDSNFSDELVKRFEKITKEDVMKVADKYLHPNNRTVGVHLPDIPGGGKGKKESMKKCHPFNKARFYTPSGSQCEPEITFPKVYEYIFENGIRLLGVEQPEARALYISGFMKSGSIFDPPDKAGLSYLTHAFLDQGTAKKDARKIAEAAESLGATLGFYSDKDTTSFDITCLPEDSAKMFALLKECLSDMKAPTKDFERVRQQVITSLKSNRDSTSYMANLAASEAMYGKDHPYARDPRSTEENLLNLGRSDVLDFAKQFYGPQNMTLVMAGPMRFTQMCSVIDKVFAMWKNEVEIVEPEFPVRKPITEVEKKIVMPGKSQCDIVCNFFGPTRSDRDFHPVLVANNIFGQFGLMGRLGNVIRETMGLAYYAYSYPMPMMLNGEWKICAGVNPANLRKAIDAMKDEIERLRTKQVESSELNDSKGNLLGKLPLDLENGKNVCQRLMIIAKHKLPLDYFERYYKDISSISRPRVKEIADTYLSSAPIIAVAGPEYSEE